MDYYVPEGRWTDYFSGKVIVGPRWVRETHGFLSLPLLVRYPEVRAGRIDHALRVTVQRTQRGYIHPATHLASSDQNAALPRAQRCHPFAGAAPCRERGSRRFRRRGLARD